MAGIDAFEIQYKNAADAVTDVITGRIDYIAPPEELRKRYEDWMLIFGKIVSDAGVKPPLLNCDQTRAKYVAKNSAITPSTVVVLPSSSGIVLVAA
jgi:hypothetical protein